MQYYLDGFRPGDPDIRPAAPRKTDPADVVDVLVIGNGPAGSIIAAQLAEFPSISTRFIERRETAMEKGQADGVASRTIEMFTAFGLAEKLNREAYRLNETVFWGPDEDNHRIVRTGRTPSTADDLSEYPSVIVNQARLQQILVEKMGNSPTRLQPEFGMEVQNVTVPADPSQPVSVTVRQLTRPGQPETVIHARYVVGCDGARSVVRQSLGLELKGDPQYHAWGVLDVLAQTTFPDIRRRAIIVTPTGGLSVIPREGGYLTRVYVDLGEIQPGDHEQRAQVTKEFIVDKAKQLFAPYAFEPKEITWWSRYEVAQRLTDRFDDVPDEQRGTRSPRVFIAGDACHTHSAKAGQGMNVSMQDTFNLGWKLAAVLEGRSPAGLLDTYNAERQPVAQSLIDFDRAWAPILGGKNPDAPDETLSTDEIRARFQQSRRFTTGLATHYPPSLLIGEDTHQKLATGYPIGMRFYSAQVTRMADSRRMHLGHVHQADGRWRLYAFADGAPITSDTSRLRALCDFLRDSAQSPLRRFTPADADIDAILDVRGILQQSHHDVDPEDLPALLFPVKGSLGLNDYEKAFTPDTDGDIFDQRGIDRDQGALVVVRPDQYVAHVLPLDAHDELAEFLARFMNPVG
ncbi:FAD-dependent monooxygenase [Kutzneria chonburiensis]|uniref:FAD-dependent monooxygenase n=1 Tax=Kutzneria chonburiensis TaxID=1483604 RepID=A0ABV6MTH8_9PSEU|nr:FAD-dependent monooxygenase [Kutzneria chonburiensis]